MLIKKVKASWLYIGRTDDNDNYRVTFEVDKDLDKTIMDALGETLRESGSKSSINKCDWRGSRSEKEGVITYSAKCSRVFKNKKGEEVIRSLPVYDIKANLLDENTVPQSIANGAIINLVVEPYYTKYKNKEGVMLGLRSVQLIDYEEFTGDNPYENESDEDDNAPFKNEDKSLTKASEDIWEE
ncbi:TPA: hypothetical protein R1765_001947 [Campylobacter coli]|nr:hypothetical protein [Campylobacter coli]